MCLAESPRPASASVPKVRLLPKLERLPEEFCAAFDAWMSSELAALVELFAERGRGEAGEFTQVV